MSKYGLENLFELHGKEIADSSADLQTDTCEKIIDILQDNLGVILGDDVGMGKTYVAIATAAYYLSKWPKKPVIIITPSWLLNNKWHQDLLNFIEVNNRSKKIKKKDVLKIDKCNTVEYLKKLKKEVKGKKIILLPINALANSSWKIEKAFFISCWFRRRGIRQTTRRAVLKELVKDPNYCANPLEFDMWIGYEDIKDDWLEEIDSIYHDKDNFEQKMVKIDRALANLRNRAMKSIFPNCSLFILDEAHKIKNKNTVKYKSIEQTLAKKYERTLFLTATPFQLNEVELTTILLLFQNCSASKDKCLAYKDKVGNLLNEIQRYIALAEDFQDTVKNLPEGDAGKFQDMVKKLLECGEKPLEEALGDVNDSSLGSDCKFALKRYKDLYLQKISLEKIMKTVIVRNIKNKNGYRREIVGDIDTENKHGIPLTAESYIPFALWEKAIYELMDDRNRGRTFIPTVQQSITSSFEAAKGGNIFNWDLESLKLLNNIGLGGIRHPKLSEVVNKAVETVKSGEKILIFCGRVETVKTIKAHIEKNLSTSYKEDIKNLFPENGEQGYFNYHRRFYNKQDISWLSLQDSYMYTVLPHVLKGKTYKIKSEDIADEVSIKYRVFNTTKKVNYMYLKRIVEQVVFKRILAQVKHWDKGLSSELRQTVQNIIDEDYIYFGISRAGDDEYIDNYPAESRTESRSITARMIKNIIEYKGIWVEYAEKLNEFLPEERERLVAAMINFLQRDKRFFLQLKKVAQMHPGEDDNFCILKTFKKGGLLDWDKAFERFLTAYCNAPTATREAMLTGLKSGDVVGIISGETRDEKKEKLKEGFNTPFYPKVLVATSIMQEGIDLQKECAIVIHHDLEWNPASMEQRIGRIDRINSLISKLIEQDEGKKLDIYYPYIKNTIDENIYKTVKEREKWFNLILGGTPDWSTFEVDENITPISGELFKIIQIDLSVSKNEK